MVEYVVGGFASILKCYRSSGIYVFSISVDISCILTLAVGYE